MYRFLKGLLNIVVQIIFPYKFVGNKKIDKGVPCVLVGNHYRLWDIVHMACASKDRVHFISKKEVYDNKFLGFLAKKIEALPVSRDGNDLKAVMTALKYLKKAKRLQCFPKANATERMKFFCL